MRLFRFPLVMMRFREKQIGKGFWESVTCSCRPIPQGSMPLLLYLLIGKVSDPWSDCRDTAVHEQLMARNEAAFVRCQEQHCASDLFETR